MSKTYIPLYRKYRPQTFSDLIGQENITQALSNAIKLNKVAHAYLFCGPRGTGKTSSARILAKSLNCVDGPTVTPCGKCPSCIDITNTTPVDVIEIDAASNRSVEDAQNILEKIQYVPIHGKYKIYIIDEVHMLSNTAFNALLKTLEEPPENVVFILATTEAHQVLETIVSRCQRFDFRRITIDDIIKRLEYISEQEKINISRDALHAIAQSAQGGMRDALALLDQLSILDTQKQIDVEDVENLLGKISVNVLYELTEKITSNVPQEAIIEINNIYAKGNEPLQILTNLTEYFRNLLIIKTCADKETVLSLTRLNSDLIEKLSAQAAKLDTFVINYTIDRLATYLREIKNSTDRYLWLEVCIIELSNKLSTVGFSDLVGRIEALENAISGGISLPTSQKQTPIQIQKATKQSAPATFLAREERTIQQEIPSQPAVSTPTPPAIASKQDTCETTATESQAEQAIAGNNTVQNTDISASLALESVETTAISEFGIELWEVLLSKFTSLPSKMFFTQLFIPIQITPQKVVLGSTQPITDNKMEALKVAVTALFGNSDMPIDIKLISDSEVQEFKTGKKKTNPIPVVTAAPADINTKDEKSEQAEEKEFYESELAKANETKTPQISKNHSDQAKMILDLFNGKFMD